MRKRVRTYRDGVDEYGVGAGRVATTDRAPRATDPQRATKGMQRATTGRSVQRRVRSTRRRVHSSRRQVRSVRQRVAAHDNGSATRDDGYKSLKKIGQRRVHNTRRQVQGRATTGVARATTAEIAQRRVAGQVTTGRGSGDDELRIGRRRVRPRVDASPSQYIKGAD